MRHIAFASIAAGLLAGCAAQQAETAASQQAELAETLAGRTAGEPVACVNLRDIRGNRGFGGDAILFEGPTNSLVYLNRPPAGCPDLSSFRAIRIETTINRLCRGDTVTVFDPVTGVEHGSCGLGDFIPYRK